MKKCITILCFSFILIMPGLVSSQDMQDGFQLLESGKNHEASIYFNDIIQDYPENKTALICYGRAIGLSGQPSKAISIFEKLSTSYPEDKEVLLNLAESLLWNKQNEEAINQYKSINKLHANDSNVLRSLANAYAANQDFGNAYIYILRSINLDQINDASKLSLRSIGLAYAHQLKVEHKYAESLRVLEHISLNSPNNKDIIISKAYTHLANNNLELSREEFLKLQTNKLDTTKSYLGLATIALQKQQYKSSIEYLESNYFKNKILSTQDSIQRYDLLFGNLLNTKPKKAERTLNQYLKPHLSLSQYSEKLVYAKLATQAYQSIPALLGNIENKKLKQDNTLRYILEADRYKEFKEILNSLDQSLLDEYSYSLIEKIETELSFNSSASIQYAEDNAENASKELLVQVSAPSAATIAPFVFFKSRWLQSPAALFTANHSVLRLGSSIKLKHNQLATISLGVESNNTLQESISYKPSYHLSYLTEINNRHYIKLIASRSQLNYNQDLLSENIWKTNIGLEHHIVSLSGLGSYTQLNTIRLNDGNSGIDGFNSLYYNLSNTPVIQAGLNSTILAYKNENLNYYSPNYVFSFSPFFKITNEYQTTQDWKYQIMFSAGQQFEATAEDSKLIYSIQLKSGYVISRNLYGEAFYTYANNNSSLNNGFSTYLTGIRIRLVL